MPEQPSWLSAEPRQLGRWVRARSPAPHSGSGLARLPCQAEVLAWTSSLHSAASFSGPVAASHPRSCPLLPQVYLGSRLLPPRRQWQTERGQLPYCVSLALLLNQAKMQSATVVVWIRHGCGQPTSEHWLFLPGATKLCVCLIFWLCM